MDSRLRGNDGEVQLTRYALYKNSGVKWLEKKQTGKQRTSYSSEKLSPLVRVFGKGFSVANLRNFRQFYQIFPDFGKRYALRSELLLMLTHLPSFPSRSSFPRRRESIGRNHLIWGGSQ